MSVRGESFHWRCHPLQVDYTPVDDSIPTHVALWVTVVKPRAGPHSMNPSDHSSVMNAAHI